MTKRSYDGEELGPAARPRPALNVNMGGLRGDLYATPRSPAKTDCEDILSKSILPADCVKMIAISAPSTSHLFVSESTGFVYKAPFPASTYEPMLNHEFAILAALSRPPHPNIVLLAPSGYQDTKEPRRYFAMERLTQDLAKYLASAPRPSAEFVWGVLRDVARGLKRIHSLNIVHGDIRLMNLLLDKDNRVKIADFGTAAKPGDSLRGVSKNWWILLAGDASFTPELDMFCLGLAALQLLTGGASDIRKSLGDDDVRYIPENLEPLLKTQQDAKLANAIRRLLKKDPKERLTPEGLLELAGPATNEK